MPLSKKKGRREEGEEERNGPRRIKSSSSVIVNGENYLLWARIKTGNTEYNGKSGNFFRLFFGFEILVQLSFFVV